MRSFSLHHPRGETRHLYGLGAVGAATPELAAWVGGRRLFVVTTPVVWGLHGKGLDRLRGAAADSWVLEVPEGEAAKTVATAQELWRAMVAAGGKRDSRLVAFGGGSVGDLAGFVAACFLRGIEVAQLPTTLLGQVDAAVGGKTALDLPELKNAVGAFHHPRLVVAETSWLATLDPGELRSGLVEAVKVAFLVAPELFVRIEDLLGVLLAGEPGALSEVAAAAAAAKAGVVQEDPEERGRRKLLNFGHTLGHAVEAALGYQGLRHGEAVAHGMLFALRLARRRGLPRGEGERLEELLRRLSLPPLPALDAEALYGLMAKDKKVREEGLGWVLPAGLGEGRLDQRVPRGEVLEELSVYLTDAREGGRAVRPWAPHGL